MVFWSKHLNSRQNFLLKNCCTIKEWIFSRKAFNLPKKSKLLANFKNLIYTFASRNIRIFYLCLQIKNLHNSPPKKPKKNQKSGKNTSYWWTRAFESRVYGAVFLGIASWLIDSSINRKNKKRKLELLIINDKVSCFISKK